jgi:aryl-alcohol dehydrogenase-like predicted oxidoreductase
MKSQILKYKLVLGTVQFGLDYGISNVSGQISFEEAIKIIDTANIQGINFLDTAHAYGNSEAVLGKIHANRFNIVTKFIPETESLSLEKQFDISLKKLNVSRLYGYIAHNPMDVFQNKSIWTKLLNLKYLGKVQKIGFSFDSPEEYFIMDKLGIVPDLVQIPFNYFDNRFIEVMKELKKKNCEIHTRSPFLQGLFFANVDNLSNQFESVKPIINHLQETYKSDLQGVLLKYVLNNDLVDKVVFGVQTEGQLLNNINSLNQSIDLENLDFQIENNIIQPSKWEKKIK